MLWPLLVFRPACGKPYNLSATATAPVSLPDANDIDRTEEQNTTFGDNR
jgi:hypothetical protein